MSRITVLGSGMMGSAITVPLCTNGNEVHIVGSPLDDAIIKGLKENGYHITLKRQLPEGITYHYFSEFWDVLPGSDLMLSGVSSFGVDWFAENIIPKLPASIPVLSVTKGMLCLEDGSLISYPEYYETLRSDVDFNAVGGPCTSYELADLDPTEVTFCGRKPELLHKLRAMFETEYYHVSTSTDVCGVECAVAMKNAYALGVSLAIGMSYAREGREFEHYNSQAALFGQSIREMTALLKLCGGAPENIVLGAGDLYVTVFGGRTRKIGTLLGTGMSFDAAMESLKGVTLESIVIAKRTAEAIRRLTARGIVGEAEFPLLRHIDTLINEGAKVNIPWNAFEVQC